MSAKSPSRSTSVGRDIIPSVRVSKPLTGRMVITAAIHTLAFFASLHLVVQIGYAATIRDWSPISLVALLNLRHFWPNLAQDESSVVISVVVIAVIWLSLTWRQRWELTIKRK